MTTAATSRPRITRRRRGAFLGLSVLVSVTVVSLLPFAAAGAAEAPLLGTSEDFAILATTAITNTGPTVVNGDIGTAPNNSQPGYAEMIHTGTNFGNSEVTSIALADALAAYNNALTNAPTEIPTELGGTVTPLTPGVYDSASGELGITGTLTLDGLNDPDSVFIFQAGSTLTTAAASNVLFINDAQPCNVFWIVGSSATFGATSYLGGTVLADTSISAGNGATFDGRLFALDGAVTLDTNTINVPACAAAVTTTTEGSTTVPTTEGTTPTTTPSDSTPTTTPSDSTPTTTAPTPTIPEGGDTPPPADTVNPGTAVPPTPVPSANVPAAVPPAAAPPADVPPANVPPSDVPPADVPPADVPPSSGAPRLPYTGTEASGLGLLGLALIGIGGSAMYLSRRRRHKPLHLTQPGR